MNFTDLIAWQKAHQLVLEIYKATAKFPKEELYGLVSQMRRCSVSVPANVAEGFRRLSKKEKLRFYNISQGSLEELKYYIILSNDLNYLKAAELDDSIEEVSRLLNSLVKSTLHTE